MGRNILFITTDQQRWDSLGCYGNRIAQTPVADALAADGIRYERAYCQGSVCMPSRATMITGQHVATHGVYANGVALPIDAPSVAAHLKERAGYRTALLGKAHFEPGFDPTDVYPENRLAVEDSTGPLRGFEHLELAMHVAQAGRRPLQHYGHWLAQHHPEHTRSFASLLGAQAGGETGPPETKLNPIPREWYHTDWVAEVTVPEPVGYVDLAPTFCAIAGLEPADWMEGVPLPTRPGSGRERVLSEWNSQFGGYGMHQRTIYRDGWLCTAYGPSTRGRPTGVEPFLESIGMREPRREIDYNGSEGELYRVDEDPHQHANRWDDPSLRRLRDELVEDLDDHMPPARVPRLPVSRPT